MCRPFRAWGFLDFLTQGGADYVSLALGYFLLPRWGKSVSAESPNLGAMRVAT